jgi:hypothetical protein
MPFFGGMTRDWGGPAIAAGALVVAGGLAAALLLPSHIVDDEPRCESLPPTTTQVTTGSRCLTPADRLKAENDVRTTIVQATAGALFFVTAFFAWKTVQQSRAANDNQRLDDAISHLGATDKFERLGGIVSLGRHAAVTNKDVSDVALLLAAYCRATFPRPTSDVTPDGTDVTRLGTRSPALQIVFLEFGARSVVTNGIDLSKVDARRADLRRLKLRGINLSGSALNAAELDGADLRGSNLKECDFRHARLGRADLRGADLSFAWLEGADLRRIKASAKTEWGHATVDAQTQLPPKRGPDRAVATRAGGSEETTTPSEPVQRPAADWPPPSPLPPPPVDP